MANIVGYTQLTGVTSGATSPATGYGQANAALIAIETQAVRWRMDGTAPTSTVGHPMAAGDVLYIEGDVQNLVFIGQSGSAAVVNLTWLQA